MVKLHVVLKKEDLNPQRLRGKIVIVLDILFATSAMVTALAHGAAAVIPARNEADARESAALCNSGTFVLAGEYMAETPADFAPPWPLALISQNLSGKRLIYATTNGTVAVHRAMPADHVYIASLLNADIVVRHVLDRHAGRTIVIACAGSAGAFNLEDFFGAGRLVSLFKAHQPYLDLSDTALAASRLHNHADAMDCIAHSRVGRMMEARQLSDEVRFAAQADVFGVVPKLTGGVIRNVT